MAEWCSFTWTTFRRLKPGGILCPLRRDNVKHGGWDAVLPVIQNLTISFTSSYGIFLAPKWKLIQSYLSASI